MGLNRDFDVVVVGGGHAGIEAALAAARVGARTALVTSNLDTIGQMSCNPAIGGVGKGQIVREVDALGGAMGRLADAAAIQFRMLNRRKGPAMHGPRAQADRRAYQQEAKRLLEEQGGLSLCQDSVEGLRLEDGRGNPRVCGVRVTGGAEYGARAVVLCTGTFLRGELHLGPARFAGGRLGEAAQTELSPALEHCGLRLGRFKTGTPPRLHGRTIDYTRLEEQPGDPKPEPFSFLHERVEYSQLPCWITYTNAETHRLITANLDQAPLYTGQIQSTGPRYCPSVETKIVRFPEKTRHQIFLEPEGRSTVEMYVNGLSTSLPRPIQEALVHSIAGLEWAEILRFGYAIEYDYVLPDQLRPSLETKAVTGLFLAGQINGTTGYEEAAGQGLIAGANAALFAAGRDPFVPSREQSYLGVMIDDLVSRSVDEPYRMFTSRAEYRLLLRQDNADRRLTGQAFSVGLVDKSRYQAVQEKEAAIAAVKGLLERTRCGDITLAHRLRQPEVTWEDLLGLLPELGRISPAVAQQVAIDLKYSGYVARQEQEVARQQRLATHRIPAGFDYSRLEHLRAEAREKLARVQPANFAEAGRISGITPADLVVLLAALSRPTAESRA